MQRRLCGTGRGGSPVVLIITPCISIEDPLIISPMLISVPLLCAASASVRLVPLAAPIPALRFAPPVMGISDGNEGMGINAADAAEPPVATPKMPFPTRAPRRRGGFHRSGCG